MLEHLKTHGVDLKLAEVCTDLGTEFDGATVHYHPEGFHGAIAAIGARHRFNPSARTNCNVDVESVHATIENEFFDLENFSGRARFMAAAGTYQHYYNFARKNRSRANKTPVELFREKASNLPPPHPPFTPMPARRPHGSTSVWISRVVLVLGWLVFPVFIPWVWCVALSRRASFVRPVGGR
ncbi:MAG: hypothetical protein LBD01_04645 [Puniceicoccales bacterium]|jgi:hypothetical protein|nr:hypothetical protein [Puniceicoccales bacterium]